jgi:hypothetical protein
MKKTSTHHGLPRSVARVFIAPCLRARHPRCEDVEAAGCRVCGSRKAPDQYQSRRGCPTIAVSSTYANGIGRQARDGQIVADSRRGPQVPMRWRRRGSAAPAPARDQQRAFMGSRA